MPQLEVCCDNCVRKTDHTSRFGSIYDLIGFLDAFFGQEPISCPRNDNRSDLGPTTSPKSWGNLRTGDRRATRRRALEAWRYDCWKRDYQLCSWGVAGVMSDAVLSKLASYTKVNTLDDLVEAVSDWSYADKYGNDVLSLLKDADQKHQLESRAQRTKMRQLGKKRKIEDLETDGLGEQQYSTQSAHPGPSSIPLQPVHSSILYPVLVKHVTEPPVQRAQPSHPWPCPTFVSHPYTRNDVFDSVMDNLKCE